jgi:phage baseplate assembly protein W
MANADSFNKLGFVDAQSSNESSSSTRQYSDLDLFFVRKSSTSDVNKLMDIQAVKRSIRNLILTQYYEKPFHPEIGSGVRGALFELNTFVTSIILEQQVRNVIENFEPRAKLVSVLINESDFAQPSGAQGFDIRIDFTVLNIQEQVETLNVLLERTR